MDFEKRDKKFLAKNKSVVAVKTVGTGTNGQVSEIQGNSNLVVKQDRSSFSRRNSDSVSSEYKFFKKYNLEKEDIFAPTKDIKVNAKKSKKSSDGIIHPKLKIISTGDRGVIHPRYLTPSVLAKLKKSLTELTYKGYMFSDGLQLGEDRLKRIMDYDFGDMQKVDMKKSVNVRRCFYINNKMWRELGRDIKKDVGYIQRNEAMDKKFLSKVVLTNSMNNKNKSNSDKSKKQISIKRLFSLNW